MAIYLETERLRLRQFTADDVELLVALDGDPEVMRYLSGGGPTPRAVVEQRILPGFLASYGQREGFGVWAVVERASGDFIGWLSLRPAPEDSADEASVGYRLRKSAWGKGYATEGVRALMRRAFTELGVRRVTASTYERNTASRRVMEKAGMTLVRSFRLAPDDLAATDTFDTATAEVWDGDDVEYALDRAEWARREAAGR